MTCTTPARVTRGSAVTLELTYANENGVAEDISDDIFAVSDAFPAVLLGATLTKTDPENGVLTVYLSDEDAASLKPGNTNRLRISREFPSGDIENSEEIRIEVR